MAGNGGKQFVGKSGCAKKGKRESAPDSFFALTTRPENSDSVWPASFGQIGAKYDKREVQDLRNLLGQSEMILPHCGKEKEKEIHRETQQQIPFPQGSCFSLFGVLFSSLERKQRIMLWEMLGPIQGDG